MKNITVIGVGALGSHLVQFLRSEDVKLKVIDFDHVEQKNVQSQFHSKTLVRSRKVFSLQKTMDFLFGVKIETVSSKLVDNNVEQLLGGADLIVDCLDNGEARRLVQGYVREKGIPCLHGALAADGSFGRVIWDKDFVIDDESVAGAATCEDGEFLPFIALTSAYLARSAQVFLRTGSHIGFSISSHGTFSI